MKSHPIILALLLSGETVWAQTTDAQTGTNAASAQWIWNKIEAKNSSPIGEKVYFRKTVELPAFVEEAFVFVTADNDYTLFINGTEAGQDTKWETPEIIDIREFLLTGKNVIAVEALNRGFPGSKQPSPAGLFLYACIRQKDSAQFPRILDFATDQSWQCSTNAAPGWAKTDFKPVNWQASVALGDLTVSPWSQHGLNEQLTEALVQGRTKE